MSDDMTAHYEVMKCHSQEKRAHNREESPRVLAKHGIKFASRNRGAHLIVSYGGRTADFWPGTGKWIERGGKSGRGVFNLVRLLTGAEVKP